MTAAPKNLAMQISETAVYLTDNGRMLCGKHLGYTARTTGHDISGLDIIELTPALVRAGRADGLRIPKCETCGLSASHVDQEG